MANYYTADTHFGHKNILTFCPNRKEHARSIEEMNEVMIQNWNKVVRPNDTVFHMGDVAFLRAEEASELIRRLNGKIHLMAGNHDRKELLKVYASHFDSIEKVGRYFRMNKTSLYLSHYGIDLPTKMFSIHGHIHDREYEELNKINVGVDSSIGQHLPLGEPISQDALWEVIEERKKQINELREFQNRKRSRQ